MFTGYYGVKPNLHFVAALLLFNRNNKPKCKTLIHKREKISNSGVQI